MPLKLGHVTWGRYVARKPTKHTVVYCRLPGCVRRVCPAAAAATVASIIIAQRTHGSVAYCSLEASLCSRSPTSGLSRVGAAAAIVDIPIGASLCVYGTQCRLPAVDWSVACS